MKCKRTMANHYAYRARCVEHALCVFVVRNHIGHHHLRNQWPRLLHSDGNIHTPTHSNYIQCVAGVIPVQQPLIQSAVSYSRRIYNTCNMYLIYIWYLIYITHAGYIESTPTMESRLTHTHTHTRHQYLWAEWTQLITIQGTKYARLSSPISVFCRWRILSSSRYRALNQHLWMLFNAITRQKLSLTHALSVVWLSIWYKYFARYPVLLC
jgi:hypothetical protein